MVVLWVCRCIYIECSKTRFEDNFRPSYLIPWSTKGGQLDHLERKKSKKILHKHNVKEGSWFTRSVDTAQRETRFSTCNMNLNSKQCNLDIRRNFFSLRVIKRWNSLPVDIKNATSLISFKNMYDIFLQCNRCQGRRDPWWRCQGSQDPWFNLMHYQ